MIIGREKDLQQLREAARGDGDFDSLHRVHMELLCNYVSH